MQMPSRMEILPAALEDCRSIAEVHVESWQHAYREVLPEQYLASLSVVEREAMWCRVVKRHPSHLLLARSIDEVVGFIAFGPERDDGAPRDQAEVWALYVKPAFWSTGAGRLLWLAALQQMLADGFRSVSLWVIAGNARAVRFYERAGFVAEPEARRFVELGGASLEQHRYVYRHDG